MTRREFLSITPKEFDAYCKRLYQRDRKQRYNAAMVCAAVWEVYRDRSERSQPFTPEFFLGEDSGWQSDEQQVLTLRRIFGVKDPTKPFTYDPEKERQKVIQKRKANA